MTVIEQFLRQLRQVEKEAAPAPVHHLRTSIRRLEATLDGGIAAVPRLEKRLRRLRRAAGKVRDLDVQMERLRNLHLDGDYGRHALLENMQAARERAAQRLSSRITSRRRRKLAKHLRQAHAAVAPLPSPALRLQQVRDGFLSLDRHYSTLDAGNLHEFRKRCKRLRYQAEIAEPPVEAAHLVDQFRQIQDVAGAWHDWSELARRAHATSLDTPSPLTAALDNAAASAFAQAIHSIGLVRARLRRHFEMALRRPPASTSAPMRPNARASA